MDKRTMQANELLRIIDESDRSFFNDKNGNISYFLIINNRVCYNDKYTNFIIKQFPEYNGWYGFSNGGTMREFILQLVLYIRKGKPRYKKYYFNAWGISEENKEKIRQKMIEIGFLKED